MSEGRTSDGALNGTTTDVGVLNGTAMHVHPQGRPPDAGPGGPDGPAVQIDRPLIGALRRFVQPRTVRRAGERCEMCSEPVVDGHAHLVNVETRSLVCACRACYLLFTRDGAAQGKYRAIPDRYLYDPSFQLTDAQWDQLQIPVRIAFFFFNSSLGRVVAFYPGPAGATESLLPSESWEQTLAAHPVFATMVPDVEAVLVNRLRDHADSFLAPIDACYELVGRVRRVWKGFDGGTEAWSEIDGFFAALREKSRTVTP